MTNSAPNRLINEKSPYLLQHAYNPVDWYPWGAEAFDKARQEDKPVFLSIGYSTCHWCHVMAHESFEDREVAEALNRDYIPVKVDREERPDIDSVYMSVCQAMTGSGGWPLTVIMTPEQKPFYADTYLPKTSRYGKIGLVELLGIVSKQWKKNREKLLDAGNEIVNYLQEQTEASVEPHEPDKSILRKGAEQLSRSFDKKWGGFGVSPKFPTPHNLLFLLRYSVLESKGELGSMVEKTLEQMYRGGIFDHIGGGFSRYSTDREWLVPHFEKMLYDNALLAYAYLEAYELTKRPLYRRVAEKTLEYVQRELSDPQGGFYCSQDADSEGVEGKYYVLTPDEAREALGDRGGDLFCKWFGITGAGNFEGKSIPNLIGNARYEEDNEEIPPLCRKMYQYRSRRTVLHKDDKVLTAWNSLMIAAFAKASAALDAPHYLETAKKAQKFIAKHLTDLSGRLMVRWRDGETANFGQLDDYAFYTLALLELYDATLESEYLSNALVMAEQMVNYFFDSKIGGFFLYSEDGEQLISRPKEVYDGAMPSGNSAAALILLRLAALTGESKWLELAGKQLRYIAGVIRSHPASYSFSMLALLYALYPSGELICVTSEQLAPKELRAFLRENYIPNLAVLVKTPENQTRLSEISPFTKSYPIPNSGSMYYLCRNKACFAPVSDMGEIKKLLFQEELKV